MSGPVAVTVDLDWASDAAVAGLLDHLRREDIPVTVFATHASPCVAARFKHLEVGLHPHFGAGSSHGATVEEVVRSVMALPHNLPAFRCHRFASSNEIREGLASAGMRISSNVCADLDAVPPYRDRTGLLELPVFFEDGGYLYRGHPLNVAAPLAPALERVGPKIVLLHPMHFAINTPSFGYMREIKRSTTREAWAAMSPATLEALRFRGRGIRDLILDFLDLIRQRGLPFTTIGALARGYGVDVTAPQTSMRIISA